MKPYRGLLTVSAIFFAVLIAASVLQAQSSSSDCDCKFRAAEHGRSQTLIENKELSSAAAAPTSGDLLFPKTLTVCMFFDQTDKGYPVDLHLLLDGSIDGRNWFPLTLAGTKSRAEGANTCLQVAPVRYVRASWPAGSTIPSPGPRTTIQVQASY